MGSMSCETGTVNCGDRDVEQVAAALADACHAGGLADTYYRCADDALERIARRLGVAQTPPHPIPMVLHCPVCTEQHIDAAEPETGWTNPPHKSHLCHWCGTVWRPADVPTTGVTATVTKGKADTWERPDADQRERDRALHSAHTAPELAAPIETPPSPDAGIAIDAREAHGEPLLQFVSDGENARHLIWWLSSQEATAIGEEPPEALPAHIRTAYRSLWSRPRRGRLWSTLPDDGPPVGVAPGLFDDSPIGRHVSQCSGIVIRTEDRAALANLPGTVTDAALVRAVAGYRDDVETCDVCGSEC